MPRAAGKVTRGAKRRRVETATTPVAATTCSQPCSCPSIGDITRAVISELQAAGVVPVASPAPETVSRDQLQILPERSMSCLV